jgi:hypothetical protein
MPIEVKELHIKISVDEREEDTAAQLDVIEFGDLTLDDPEPDDLDALPVRITSLSITEDPFSSTSEDVSLGFQRIEPTYGETVDPDGEAEMAHRIDPYRNFNFTVEIE